MKTTVNAMAAAIIGRRVFGPFREEGGFAGERAAMRLDTAARAYQWNRRVRGMGAARALELAIPYALCPHTVRPPQWYGSRGVAGQAWQERGDSMRWLDDTAALGLRLVGYADKLPGGPDHNGWYADSAQQETLRGAVWQLPGRKGRARLVYGYVEMEGRHEMNPGSGCVCVSDIVTTGDCRQWESITDLPEIRDAAQWADGMAESVADDRREDSAAYNAGRDAAELQGEAIAARRELLPLLAELRAERARAARTLGMAAPETARPAICKAIRERVAELMETISEKRAARDSAWGDCPSRMESSWLSGWIDYADNGQAIARALGWIKADAT